MEIIKIINRRAKSLKKERDNGNIEYKFKLVNISHKKQSKLISQMNYRLREGNGKSMYAIGFLDNGFAKGITKSELKITLRNILSTIKKISAKINKILIFKEDIYYYAKVFINKKNTSENWFD